MKRIYLVRHCAANGQHRDSPLTREGIRQAAALSDFFKELDISFDLILSSPFLRAIESIKPYAEANGLTIKTDERLQERILSEEPIDDWLEALEQSFIDDGFSLPGGESAKDVVARSNDVLRCIYDDSSVSNAIIVSHGNLLSHFFHQFDPSFGFKQWKELRNPDIYLLQKEQNHPAELECIWDVSQS
ncbi:histidine phosphatase family protein [Oceanobacillus massiliensis]|uniref:histidine phosphatase family protein n=1 Tax=Oceanobacillus massiliensis TaxID=1465765 RepID=UPI0002899AB6|nr:histidine phosphatase family protein [Oceanobacillus massiliensis]